MQSKKDLYQIGEVARLFHLSISLLRHYDKTGLVTPEYTDPNTGYRYYSIRQFECLNTIRYLRALDMPLDEIGDFLHNRDTGRIQELLSKQLVQVHKKQQELTVIEHQIKNRLSRRDLFRKKGTSTVGLHEKTAKSGKLSGSGVFDPGNGTGKQPCFYFPGKGRIRAVLWLFKGTSF